MFKRNSFHGSADFQCDIPFLVWFSATKYSQFREMHHNAQLLLLLQTVSIGIISTMSIIMFTRTSTILWQHVLNNSFICSIFDTSRIVILVSIILQQNKNFFQWKYRNVDLCKFVPSSHRFYPEGWISVYKSEFRNRA